MIEHAVQRDGDDDAGERRATGSDPQGKRSASEEVLVHRSHSWSVCQAVEDAAKDALCQDELVVFFAETGEHDRENEDDRAGDQYNL